MLSSGMEMKKYKRDVRKPVDAEMLGKSAPLHAI